MAGYEAMQRGAYGPRGGDDASPQANEPFDGASPGQQSPGASPGENAWGESYDPWDGNDNQGPPPPSAGGEEGGGGWGDFLGDFFGDDDE